MSGGRAGPPVPQPLGSSLVAQAGRATNRRGVDWIHASVQRRRLERHRRNVRIGRTLARPVEVPCRNLGRRNDRRGIRRQVRPARALVVVPDLEVLEECDVLRGEDLLQERRTDEAGGDDRKAGRRVVAIQRGQCRTSPAPPRADVCASARMCAFSA